MTKRMDDQTYYTEDDYSRIKRDLPKALSRVRRKVAECLVPTWDTRMKAMDIIRKYIRENKRIVYGGTAIDELVKKASSSDCIYAPYQFADIEFYSPEPAADIVNLANLLYNAGFDAVSAVSAQHEETFSLRADYVTYCDASYIPKRIDSKVMVIEINGIKYAHPHFIMIDMFRIFNQPLTAAEQRWEKTYERMYKLQKYYPFRKLNDKINTVSPKDDIANIINNIKSDFFKSSRSTMLIAGYDAYNLMIRYVKNHKIISKKPKAVKRLESFVCKTPYLELISTEYVNDVKQLYAFIKNLVHDDLSIQEFWPLFQFTGRSVIIRYKDRPVVRVFQSDGFCVPNVDTDAPYSYVGYQYILMFMMIKRFAAFIDRENEERHDANVAISNLLETRDIFLTLTNESPINNTPITDFRVSCIGNTVEFRREYFLRLQKMRDLGKRVFKYEPHNYFSKSEEEREKINFDPSKFNYANSSGNVIKGDHWKLFPLDSDNNILDTTPEDDPDQEQE